MSAEVFFATVAQPNAELLRNFIFLIFGELIVEFEGAIAFPPAGCIPMRVPKPFGCSNSPTGFFDERIAC